MTQTESNRLDRYEGALLGVAVGDALGAPLEFMSAAEIQKRHGTVTEMIGGGWLSVEPGEVTDDTQMTLAVAEGIITDGDNTVTPLLMVGANFLRWYRTRPKDVGGTCAAVLGEMEKGEYNYLSDWHKAAEKIDKTSHGRTAGNGALMRAVYPGLYFKTSTAQEVAADIAKMTHWHDDSTQTVVRYTQAINAITHTDCTIEMAKKVCEDLLGGFRDRYNGREPEPTGYCVDSLVCAINAIRDTDSFEDALVNAVNRGGDADTIGAITGGLAGAIYGATKIPFRWINKLKNQPNAKTAGLFRGGAGEHGTEANVLAIRLIDLAHTAYFKNNPKPDNDIKMFKNSPF